MTEEPHFDPLVIARARSVMLRPCGACGGYGHIAILPIDEREPERTTPCLRCHGSGQVEVEVV